MFTNPQQDDLPSHSPEKQITPKQLDKSKSAFLTQTAQEELPSKNVEKTNKLDQTKLNFLQKTNEENSSEKIEKSLPKRIDPSKLAQVEAQNVETPTEKKTIPIPVQEEPEKKTMPNQVQEELELLRQLQQQKQDDDNDYENLDTKNDYYEEVDNSSPTESSENIPEAYEVEDYTKEEILNTGVSAFALYDYQAAADDEISFDPDDIITHIEKVWSCILTIHNIFSFRSLSIL